MKNLEKTKWKKELTIHEGFLACFTESLVRKFFIGKVAGGTLKCELF